MHGHCVWWPLSGFIKGILDVYRVLDTNKSLRGSSQFMTLTQVRAICELRLPFTTSYARNIAVKCRERWQMTFFSAPARGRLIPVYCRKWGASDICLKLKPNKALCSFFLCGRCKTLQTWERQSWDKIWTPKSNYKRQMTLISHKVWQLLSTCKETVSLTLSLSLALSVSHVSFSDKCLGPLDRFPPLHTKWVITSFFFYRIEEGCSCLAVCFADFPPPRL